MRLEPLYRTVFRYPDGGRGTVLEGEAGSEGHYFFVAEGTVEGRVTGRLILRNVEVAGRPGLDVRLQCAPEPLLVPGDPGELDRLVTNLVSNAVKYTPPGGTVTVTVERRGTNAVIAVADDGLGMSEEDQVGLFRPFFRTTNPDALREPGTGLGLAIVATIVERHAGEVRVRSRLGEGTTFTVTLPAG